MAGSDVMWMITWAAFAAVATAQGPVVELTTGKIQGFHLGGGTVAGFKGVPYAASTAGAGRFASPQPAASWSPAVKQAVAFGPGCPQPDHNPDVPTEQSEDCLNLNIWAPAAALANPAAKLPVGIFFHGGAFKEGSNRGPLGLYDGANFANRTNTVVMAANYRIGALGFLVTSGKGKGTATGAAGNYGIEDQTLALRWVQANAAAFGGDPDKVTFWGESAGGMSGLVHMMSPGSKGLFRSVVMESNPAGYVYRDSKQAAKFGDGFAKAVGCGDTDLGCLRAANMTDILAATRKADSTGDVVKAILAGAKLLDIFLDFVPTAGTAVLPESPLVTLGKKGGFVNPVPVLLGTNRDEGVTFIDAGLKSLTGLEYLLLVDAVFGPLHGAAIKRQYPPPGGDADARDTLSAVVTDYWFRCGSQQVAMAAAAAGQSAFMYRYTHSWSAGKQLWPQYNFPFCVGRVCHAAELPFVFHNTANFSFLPDESELSYQIVDAWAAFMATGDPNTPAFEWPAFTNSTQRNVVLDAPAITAENSTAVCQFWDKVGYNH